MHTFYKEEFKGGGSESLRRWFFCAKLCFVVQFSCSQYHIFSNTPSTFYRGLWPKGGVHVLFMTRLVTHSFFRFSVVGGLWFIRMKLIIVHIFYMTRFAVSCTWFIQGLWNCSFQATFALPQLPLYMLLHAATNHSVEMNFNLWCSIHMFC